MKKIKQLLCVLLALLTVFSLPACITVVNENANTTPTLQSDEDAAKATVTSYLDAFKNNWDLEAACQYVEGLSVEEMPFKTLDDLAEKMRKKCFENYHNEALANDVSAFAKSLSRLTSSIEYEILDCVVIGNNANVKLVITTPDMNKAFTSDGSISNEELIALQEELEKEASEIQADRHYRLDSEAFCHRQVPLLHQEGTAIIVF